MKNIFLFTIMLLLIAFQANAFDFPKIKKWTPVSKVATYNPDNLYEYINGAADQFIDYGFLQLHTRDLNNGAVQVSLDIYDMGNRMNAFGIYKTERPADQERLDIGTEAVISPPYQCLLFKENFYVKINVLEGEITEKIGNQLLEAVAEALPGEKGFPQALNLLPTKGKIVDSEAFAKNSYLGLTELTNCIYAKYQEGDKEFQYFLMLPTKEESLDKIWSLLVSKWKTVFSDKHSILFKKIPYKGMNGVILLDDKIVGVTDCSDEAQLVARLLDAIK